jgi:hypothetical protein
MLNTHVMLLSASSTDKVVSGTRIKQNDNGTSVQGEHTSEDLLTLGNILQVGVVDAASLGNSYCLGTTGWRGDVALRGSFIQRGALWSEVAQMTTVEACVAGGGSNGQWCQQAHHRRRWR